MHCTSYTHDMPAGTCYISLQHSISHIWYVEQRVAACPCIKWAGLAWSRDRYPLQLRGRSSRWNTPISQVLNAYMSLLVYLNIINLVKHHFGVTRPGGRCTTALPATVTWPTGGRSNRWNTINIQVLNAYLSLLVYLNIINLVKHQFGVTGPGVGSIHNSADSRHSPSQRWLAYPQYQVKRTLNHMKASPIWFLMSYSSFTYL